MSMAGFDGYGFVFRERPLAAFLILANHGLVRGKIPQPPDFRDGDRGFVPLALSALDVHEELLAFVGGMLLVRGNTSPARFVFCRLHALVAHRAGDAPDFALKIPAPLSATELRYTSSNRNT